MKNNLNISKFFFLTALGFFCLTTAYGQIGASVNYTTDKVLGGNVFYTQSKNSFYLGYSMQFNGQKHTVVRQRKKTYGTTPLNNGDFYWLFDLGYSRTFLEALNVEPEISIGGKNYFTNYKDGRFRDNGYSLVNRSVALAGIGLNIGYIIHDVVEPFCGYNTIKKLTFGVRIHIDLSY